MHAGRAAGTPTHCAAPPRPPPHPMQYAAELIANAKAIATPGKGILAADESTGTIGKRVRRLLPRPPPSLPRCSTPTAAPCFPAAGHACPSTHYQPLRVGAPSLPARSWRASAAPTRRPTAASCARCSSPPPASRTTSAAWWVLLRGGVWASGHFGQPYGHFPACTALAWHTSGAEAAPPTLAFVLSASPTPCVSSAPLLLPLPLSTLLQILYEETLYQNASDGTPFVKMLQSKGLIPGIKVSRGGGQPPQPARQPAAVGVRAQENLSCCTLHPHRHTCCAALRSSLPPACPLLPACPPLRAGGQRRGGPARHRRRDRDPGH